MANEKNLMAVPDARSMHTKKTPNLGGVGIFIAFSLSIMILGGLKSFEQFQIGKLLLLLAAITIMFFLGVKDDLIGISPRKKFIGQAMAAALVILFTDVRIQSLDGLFGIWELPYIISVLFSLLVFVFIINAFNLIDGIDGLAGTIAIMASTVFGFFFMLHGNHLLMLVSFILVGALLAFLRFNFSEENKLFMGDSGSLFIGFLLTYQSIGFLGMDTSGTLWFTMPNKSILILAILSFPILDTLRVFIIRISQKRSPFSADRNHIHHRLMDLGLSHKQGTLMVGLANVFVITVAFLIGDLNINIQFLIIALLVPILGLLPCSLAREKGRIKLHVPKLSRA
ncbi:MraY family glycosyltransferase [Aequorivita todarodis]|uniref:MraY family glycosyltransferase n=1 Tax=Aequorivita todarodis TaxID=2036821 RepID=UPI00234FB650|nr:MraY family glycosyltransferase [Aequorivita todarodis]MDC8001190.1 MraY family glycosyltransferase [Aequorivita todarodis]